MIASTLLVALSCSAASDLKARAEAVVTLDRNNRTDDGEKLIAEAFARIDEAELSPERLKTYDTRTLEVLFDAAATTLEHGPRPELMKPLEDIFNASLRGRGFYGHMPERLYGLYIQRRELDKARKLDRDFPMRNRVMPKIVEPAFGRREGPAVFTVSPDGKTLTYKRVDLTGPMIVSSVSPGCHFSNDAVKLLLEDPKLSKVFKERSINIESAAYSLEADDLAAENRKGPLRYDIVYKPSGWKGFDFRGTPHFYFVKDGRVLHEIDGLDPAKFKKDFADGLAKIGLGAR